MVRVERGAEKGQQIVVAVPLCLCTFVNSWLHRFASLHQAAVSGVSVGTVYGHWYVRERGWSEGNNRELCAAPSFFEF